MWQRNVWNGARARMLNGEKKNVGSANEHSQTKKKDENFSLRLVV